jgi:hypothetical protein
MFVVRGGCGRRRLVFIFVVFIFVVVVVVFIEAFGRGPPAAATSFAAALLPGFLPRGGLLFLV